MASKTCFHAANMRYGAKLIEMFGYDLPWEFENGGAAEHTATREKAGMVDLGYMAKFHITGPDAYTYLQKVLTADISKMKDGQIRYTTFVTQEGLMIDDSTIWKYGDNDYVWVTGDEGDVTWIEEQAKGFNVKIVNDTFNTGALQVQGPDAHAIMKKFTGINPKSIKYYTFQEVTIDGRYVVVSKMSFTGAGGFEYHVANKDADWLFDMLFNIGKPYGMMNFGQCALESLRQEGGYLLVGQDHDKTTNPFEVGIGQTVQFAKGDFIGKEALLKIAKEGIKKRVVWLSVPDGAIAVPGDDVMLNGNKVGTVTSGSYSPTFKKGTAMAHVSAGNAFPGQIYKIVTGGKEHNATLSLVSLYDPTGEIRRR